MDYIIAAVYGLGVGTLIAYSAFPILQWLPTVATMVVLAIGVSFVTWGPVAAPALGITIGLTSLVALALAGAVRWASHPLLADSGYWSRVWFWMWHTRTLRSHAAGESEGNPIEQ